VSVQCRAKKDAPGASNIKIDAKLNGYTSASAPLPLTTVYTTKGLLMTLAPDNASWTKDKVNALTIGLEIA